MVSKASPVSKRGSRIANSEASAVTDVVNDTSVVKTEYDQLCRELNMDTSTATAAWKSYSETRHKYILEGHQLHWLACALYVACRNSTLPTVGHVDATIEGNGVSLTRLLRSCKLSLIEFFSKAQKWTDMSNLKVEFREKITLLERNFHVSSVIFKKYQPIFIGLFKDPAQDPPKVNRSRKTKKPPCTPGEVFDFCWGLFVRVKALCPDISDDLVNSYHLLLCCVDHIYACAFVADRSDLLNDKFAGVASYTTDNRPCVVDALCNLHDGIIKEVKAIREHWWRRRIRELFDQKVLKGDSDSLTGLLEPVNFEFNAKSIRKEYESYVLSIGEYDERVFLGEGANEEIGTPAANDNTTPKKDPLGEDIESRSQGSRLIPMTPISAKHLTRDKEQLNLTPVSSSTYLVSRLIKLLGRRENGPSTKLKELFATCDTDPTEMIANRVKELGDIFYTKYTSPNLEHPGSHEPIARMRLRMGAILYYKNLETILFKERANNKPLGNLLGQEQFHSVLFACCLEIVIFSYNSPSRTFPWVLNTFDLKEFHFYKVIEVIIRAEEWLPREVVKHLQSIEEQILESRAWVSDSPLWEAIAHDPLKVPSWEDVSLSSSSGHVTTLADVTQSPLSHHGRGFVVKSPMAGDRFKSPVVTAVARRQLAFDGQSTYITSPIKAGQSILASPQKPVVQNPTRFTVIQANEGVTLDSEYSRSKRTGSLALFFRKVYTLAHMRLNHLCHGLGIGEETFKRKIWTLFEHVLKSYTDLMKDRHLDQILMCSMYIVWKLQKINKEENIFSKIINQYKKQPQAEKHVYENVLIPEEIMKAAKSEEKPNLITFYNCVFVKVLEKYVKSFNSDQPPLSPLPRLKTHPQSPIRKVSDSHPVFIRPLKFAANDEVRYNPHSPHRPLSYSFSRSPAKDLAAINALMRTEVERKSNVGKRLLTDDQPSDEPPAKMQLIMPSGAVNARLGLIIGDRTEPEK